MGKSLTKTRTRSRYIFLCSLLLLSFFVSNISRAETDEDAAPIDAGRYLLRIQTEAAPEDQQDLSIPIVIDKPQLSEKTWVFNWKTDKEWENPFNGVGVCSQTIAKLSFTIPERGKLVTWHYVGTMGDDGVASGEFKCFVDGKEAFKGKWSLKEKSNK